jgi:hypothetical protein
MPARWLLRLIFPSGLAIPTVWDRFISGSVLHICTAVEVLGLAFAGSHSLFFDLFLPRVDPLGVVHFHA